MAQRTPLLVPTEELLCACDVPHCSLPTCTGKVCFVSKRKEEGTITQHRGCFSQNILENCRTPVTEQYGMRCCDSSMCNAELEIFLQGTGAQSPSRSRGEKGRTAHPAGDVVGSLDHPPPHSAPPGSPFPRWDRASEMSSGVPFWAVPAELPAIHGVDPNAEPPSPGPSPSTKTSTLPGPPSCSHPLFPPPGEEALGKAPSLPNLLLMIFVPLLALLVLAALTALFCWKVAQQRHKKSDMGDTDLMLKASMVGDSTLEVGALQEGPKMPLRCRREGHAGCGVAIGLTLLPPRLHRTC